MPWIARSIRVGYGAGMKTHMFKRSVVLVLSVGVFALVAACKSTPKIDWNSRVGNYTFDQAVSDMGPPDKSSKLSDGSLVAEWVASRPSGGFSIGIGTGYSSGHTGVGVGQTVSTRGGAKYLRLTFGADGRLTGQNEYSR